MKSSQYEEMEKQGSTPMFLPIVDPEYEKGMTTVARFWAFHERNPHVYRAMCDLCQKAINRGMSRWSIAGVFEVLRWESTVSTYGEPWKINNNFKPYYARLLSNRRFEFRRLFETRKIKGVRV